MFKEALKELGIGHIGTTECCPAPKSSNPHTTDMDIDEIIHDIFPEQPQDQQEIIRDDVIKSMIAPQQVYIPPIPDMLLTNDQHIHSTDMNVDRRTDENNAEGAYVRVLIQPQTAQSDTGANRHLSNAKHTIANYEKCTPFPIGTIEENATVTVIGKGLTSIQTTKPDVPLVYETLYSPKASGSVFSPQKYATDNKDKIRIWSQIADTTTNLGAIIFYNHNKQPFITVPLYPRNGLWYMKLNQ